MVAWLLRWVGYEFTRVFQVNRLMWILLVMLNLRANGCVSLPSLIMHDMLYNTFPTLKPNQKVMLNVPSLNHFHVDLLIIPSLSIGDSLATPFLLIFSPVSPRAPLVLKCDITATASHASQMTPAMTAYAIFPLTVFPLSWRPKPPLMMPSDTMTRPHQTWATDQTVRLGVLR